MPVTFLRKSVLAANARCMSSPHVARAKPLSVALLALLAFGPPRAGAGEAPPDAWIDPETGHQVIRLSRREGDNYDFYFHQNPFTADGDKMAFIGSTPNGRSVFTVNIRALGAGPLESRPITTGRSIGHEIVAPKCRQLFYLSGQTVYATHLDTLETREITTVPAHYTYGRGLSVNADETKLLGCYAKGEQEFYKLPRKEWIVKIFEAKLPNALYTIDIGTGKINEFHQENAWLGHAQFSPADPEQVMFCHEGPGRQLHRVWLVRTDGTGLRKINERTEKMDYVTHEFWDPDGKHVWFDLQWPRFLYQGRKRTVLGYAMGPDYFLGCADIQTGKTTAYPLESHQWSWHYNISADGKLLCGDGGYDYKLGAESGKWIYLFTPKGSQIEARPLCSMAKHKKPLEPNVHFTPDAEWVVFQSNMHGRPQVYAVRVQPHESAASP